MSSVVKIINTVIDRIDSLSDSDDDAQNNGDTMGVAGQKKLKSETTLYSPKISARFSRVKSEMHWLYDGLQSTVLSQLDILHQSSSLNPSQMKVLDVACGDGNYSRAVAEHYGYGQIIGVEKSSAQLELARARTPTTNYPNVSFQQLAVGQTTENETLSLLQNGPFDIVLAIWLYNYAESKRDLLEFIQWTHRMLKPGGTVIAVVPTIRNIQDADIGLVKGDPKFGVQFLSIRGDSE